MADIEKEVVAFTTDFCFLQLNPLRAAKYERKYERMGDERSLSC